MDQFVLLLSSCLGFSAVIFYPVIRVAAQIIPDGTVESQVTNLSPINRTQYINGGRQRGTNLFHSFREFNIQDGSAAYFRNPTNIRTIFTRVTGNNPSLILGRLGVDGNANLFFINPKGIIFGKNATLDLTGAFIGSTASHIKFPDGNNFSAINPQDAPLLTIETPTPIGLEFSGSPGAIINAGNLESGSNLGLVGGTVVSTGKLFSPQGDLSLVTVPLATNSTVQLEATGKLATLNIRSTNPNISGTGLSLSQLVRYGDIDTGLTVDSLDRVSLPGSEIIVNPGDIAIAGQSNSVAVGVRTATFLSSQNLSLFNAQIGSKGDLNLLANDTLSMRDSQQNPLAIVAAKDLLVSGNQKVKISTLQHPKSELVAGNNLVLRSANEVDADAYFWSGGSFMIEKMDGNLGNLFSPSDPIIRSLGDVSFDTYIGASLHILAGGSVKVNNVFIIEPALPEESINPISTPDLSNVTLLDGTTVTIDGSKRPTLDIRAGIRHSAIGTPLGLTGSLDSFFKSDFSGLAAPNIANTPSSTDININTIVLDIPNGTVLLTNRYKPNLALNGDINIAGIVGSSSGIFGQETDLFVDSRRNIVLDNSIVELPGNGNIKLLANERIGLRNSQINSANSSNDKGTDINLFVAKEGGNIILENSSIQTSYDEFASLGKAGDINLESDNIYLRKQSLMSSSSISSSSGNSGKIQVIANLLDLENSSKIDTFTQTSSSANDINLDVEKLSIQSGSSIISLGANGGLSGKIDITASDSIIVKGSDSEISTNVFLLDSNNANQFINSGITIKTPNLLLEDGGKISIDASNVDPDTQSFSVGKIKVDSDVVRLDTNAIISASAIGIGNSGQIEIHAVRGISLDNYSQIVSSVTSASQGNSGGIRLSTSQIDVTNNSSIIVDNEGSGTGGSIFVSANQINLLNKSKISAENTSNTGGNIELNSGNLLLLRDGSEISTNGGTSQSLGDGGNIKINADFIVAFSAENSDITTNAYSGNGGNINITTNRIFGLENRQQLTPLSDITAISELGLDGNIEIDILAVDPTQDVASLPQNTVDPQIKQGCQVATKSNSVEFFYLGRTGLTNNPERLFPEEFVGSWSSWRSEPTNNNSISQMELGDRHLQSVSPSFTVSQFRLPCQLN